MSYAKQILYAKKNKCRFDWLEQLRIHVDGFHALHNKLSITLHENMPNLFTPITRIEEITTLGKSIETYLFQYEYGLYLSLRFYIKDQIYGDYHTEFEYGFVGDVEMGEYEESGLGWTKFHLDFNDTNQGGIDPKKHMVLLFEDEAY